MVVAILYFFPPSSDVMFSDMLSSTFTVNSAIAKTLYHALTAPQAECRGAMNVADLGKSSISYSQSNVKQSCTPKHNTCNEILKSKWKIMHCEISMHRVEHNREHNKADKLNLQTHMSTLKLSFALQMFVFKRGIENKF